MNLHGVNLQRPNYFVVLVHRYVYYLYILVLWFLRWIVRGHLKLWTDPMPKIVNYKKFQLLLTARNLQKLLIFKVQKWPKIIYVGINCYIQSYCNTFQKFHKFFTGVCRQVKWNDGLMSHALLPESYYLYDFWPC